jgi:hypothetical protein
MRKVGKPRRINTIFPVTVITHPIVAMENHGRIAIITEPTPHLGDL